MHDRGGLEMIKQQEQEAIERIKESLNEYEGSRYAQHVLAEDLETLLKLITRIEKEDTSWGN